MDDPIFKQFIGGRWCDAADGRTWTLLNPATEEALGDLPYGGADAAATDTTAALDAAAKAFIGWGERTPYDRAVILQRAAAWVRERVDMLGRITTEESGKPLREAKAEWTTAANSFEWFAEEAKRAYGRIVPARRSDRRLFVTQQPLGVVGFITAWNFPVYNVVRVVSAALAAGCTVVGKGSEYTPRSAMLIAAALDAAGLPAGALNILNGDAAAIGATLLRDPRCRKIQFTGSTRVGKLLMDGASQTVTRLSLELGGNAPVIVFPDVDVQRVARQAVSAKYRNAGQVCIAPQRFLVHARIAEEFIERTAALSADLRIGDGLLDATEVGPMINTAQRQRLEGLIAGSVAQGAQIITGGKRPDDPVQGYFFQPTVIAGLTPEMPVVREELFGPVMPILAFDDPDQAIALANASDYGLAAYVMTEAITTAVRISERLEYGMVSINDWLPSTPEMPFGGMKQSGFGREYGSEGLHEYLETKSIYLGGVQ